MFDWAGGMLMHACRYLKTAFGEDSCEIEWETVDVDGLTSLQNFQLKFEPKAGLDNDAPCRCHTVDR